MKMKWFLRGVALLICSPILLIVGVGILLAIGLVGIIALFIAVANYALKGKFELPQ